MSATLWYCVAEHALGIDSAPVEALSAGRARVAFRRHFELAADVVVSVVAITTSSSEERAEA